MLTTHKCIPKRGIGLGLFYLLLLPFLAFSSTRFTNVTLQFRVAGYSYFGGHGVCWVDVNRDGKLDLYVTNEDVQGIHAVPNILYINYDTYFQDEAAMRNVSDAYAEGTHGAVFADLDRDGDLDLFSTTTFKTMSPAFNHLYRNDGAGFFLDITSGIIPAQTTDVAPRGVAAADFDKDGDIDLYFTNPLPDPDPSNPAPSPPQSLANFYINNGDGTFTPAYRGIDWTGFTQGVVAGDIDNDGDIDIAEAKWGAPSTLYLNDGQGNFTDAGKRLGLSQALNEPDNGIAFGDVDNDGDLDIAMVHGGRVALWRNRGNSFARYQVFWLTGGGGFHPCFGDFDHDGYLELYISGGNYYDNDGEGGFFTEVPISDYGLDDSLLAVDARAAALGDFDNDGDLDIYVTAKRGHNLLFRNEINNSDWFEVEILSDNTGAAGGIGTKIDLYAAGHLGERTYLKGHREIMGEYGYLGQDMPAAHFGAPSAGGAKYDLRVTFLNGEQRIFRDLTPGQKIQVASIMPPLNFEGRKIENKALFYHETLIELAWEPNPLNNAVQKYRLYEIEPVQVLLAELPVDILAYSVRNVDKTKPYRFALTAVDTNGSESQPVYATVNEGASQTEIRRRGFQKGLKEET
jgi:hypothetical protein